MLNRINRILNYFIVVAVMGCLVMLGRAAIADASPLDFAPLTPTTPAEGAVHNRCIAGQIKCFIVSKDVVEQLINAAEVQRKEVARLKKLVGKSCV